MDINNKKLAVYGLGVSNNALIEFFANNGFNTCIYCFDDNKTLKNSLSGKNIVFKHYKDWNFNELDYIISSPGIALEYPKEHFIFQKAKEFNIPIICDIELFLQIFKMAKTIAVTGTNGKTSTVFLIEYVFKNLGLAPFLAGNVGKPIFSTPFNKKCFDSFILELSSFQLSLMENSSFDVAVLLNISQDHINYHGSFNNYIKAKTRIYNNNNKKLSCFIICVDDEYTKEIASKAYNNGFNVVEFSTKNTVANGACIIKNELQEYKNGNLQATIKLPNFNIKGEHNKQNILACYLTLKAYNNEIQSTKLLNIIANFKGVEHRQEFVANYYNINFINDSKATNMNSTSKALSVFNNNILLLGGNYKGDSIDALTKYLPKINKINMFGNSTTDKLYSLLKEKFKSLNIQRHNNLQSAILASFNDALDLSKKSKAKVNVLLSPGCSSYDEFNNFEERGNFFKEYVCKLIKE